MPTDLWIDASWFGHSISSEKVTVHEIVGWVKHFEGVVGHRSES